MSASKSIVFVGPAVAETGKTLVHQLQTGEHLELQTSIHPEVVGDIKIGTIPVEAFIAPGNDASRRLFQQTVLEESSSYHGIVYLAHPDSDSLVTAKAELAMMLSTDSPLTVLVLVVAEGSVQSEEVLSAELGLLDYPDKDVKLAATSLPLATESEGFKWLAERLS